jgi:hypothetical protein
MPKREMESDPKEIWLLDTLWNELVDIGNPVESIFTGFLYSAKTIDNILFRLKGTTDDMHKVTANSQSAAGSSGSGSTASQK